MSLNILKLFSQLFLLLTILTLSSCSSFNKFAVSSSSSMMYEASREMEASFDFESFKASALPNLKLLEGLLSVDPENEELLVTLIRGYAGYAFVVNETEYLDDYFRDIENSKHLKQLRLNYSRAIKYANRYLLINEITYNDLQKSLKTHNGLEILLNDKLSHKQIDLEVIVFLAQSVGALVNYNRTNMLMVSQLPLVKGLFDWVCSINPSINFGACRIFYGAYFAGRPKMLGGNPVKGKNEFIKMIHEMPHNWLARVAYMQYYLIPLLDEKGFNKEIYFLETAKRKFEKNNIWNPLQKEPSEFKIKRLRIYQMLAIKRFEIIKKYSKDIF